MTRPSQMIAAQRRQQRIATAITMYNVRYHSARAHRRDLAEAFSKLPLPEFQTLHGALILFSNWTDQKGVPRIVLACNTTLPKASFFSSAAPAASVVLQGEKLEFQKIGTRPRLEEALDQGALWIFSSNVKPGRQPYAILATNYADPKNRVGFICAPNVARYKGKTFAIGRAWAGTFLDADMKDYLVVRPNLPGERSVWCGYSSNTTNGMISICAETFADKTKNEFRIPVAKGYQKHAALPCDEEDDTGFKLGVYSRRSLTGRVSAPPSRICASATMQPHIEVMDGKRYLVARSNSRDPHGNPAFTAYTNVKNGGREVYQFPLVIDGHTRSMGLAANARSPEGRFIFIGLANKCVRGEACFLVEIATSDKAGPTAGSGWNPPKSSTANTYRLDRQRHETLLRRQKSFQPLLPPRPRKPSRHE